MQKVFGVCPAKTGTTIDGSMQAREIGHERRWTDVIKLIVILEEAAKNARG